MTNTSEDAARLLHDAHKKNFTFPPCLKSTLSIDEAYEIQFRLLELRQNENEKLIGSKVGLTSTAMRHQQGVHEPCLGHLIKSGHLKSPAGFSYERLYAAGFETELCLRLKAP